MKHPTIEEIKERYKNAKTVRCMFIDEVHYNIDIDEITVRHNKSNKIEYWCYGQIKFNTPSQVLLYIGNSPSKYAEIIEYKKEVAQLQNTGLDILSERLLMLSSIKNICCNNDYFDNLINNVDLSYNEKMKLNKERVNKNKQIIKQMENKINVEVTTKEQRDELIKQLQKMEFKKKLPESWEDLGRKEGFCLTLYGNISNVNNITMKPKGTYENLYAAEKQALSAKAYRKLTQLLKAYNGDWKPDWSNNSNKFIISYEYGDLYIKTPWYHFNFLALETKEKAEHFLKHHKELIKQFYMID